MSWRPYLAAQICTFADYLHRLGEKVYPHASKNFDCQTLWRRDNPLFRQIAGRLRNGERICLIYIDIVKFHEVESIYGPQTCSRILRLLPAVLNEAAGDISIGTMVGMESLGGDDFILYFSLPEDKNPSTRELFEKTQAFREKAQQLLNRKCREVKIKLHAGYAHLAPGPGQEVESRIYAGIKEAMQFAKDMPEVEILELLEEFKDILTHGRLAIVYQPIVSLHTGEIFGYEALTRGPEGSYFASPLNLFNFAVKNGSLYLLERIVRQLALQKAPILPSHGRLFLNINPSVIDDPLFRRGETIKLLTSLGLSPRQIVFELTERTSIENFSSFAKTLDHYRSQGYLIAIDDAGAGYSSLQAVAEVQPDFIKIDLSLVKDIHLSSIKRTLIETFLAFAGKIGASIIAEGIETEAELATLAELGVPYGQGFFIARPSYPAPKTNPKAETILHKHKAIRRLPRGVNVARQIMEPGTAFTPQTLTHEVDTFFKTYEHVRSVAVVDAGRPVGLLTRDRLYYHLGSHYGVALYLGRPLTAVMDANPLIVDVDLPLENVSQLAMHRPMQRLYDDIIVVQDKKYAGIISIQRLLDTITQTQIELARGANPLTGLPGNRRIEEEINARLQDGEDFTLIYVDIDNFKAFNDKYGFEKGDQAIRLLADIITQVVTRHGAPGDFTGHIGGDDFVIITVPGRADAVCQEIIANFDRHTPYLYDPADRSQGCICSYDRQGKKQCFPLMTVSLALVDSRQRTFKNHLEMAAVAAELKQYAKLQPGSIYVRDRRSTGPGSWAVPHQIVLF